MYICRSNARALALLSALSVTLSTATATAEEVHQHHDMQGLLGSYSMTRESSGTSWVPDSSPMHGTHFQYGDWSVMAHGYANLVYNDQGGKRGDEKTYSTSMFGGMASRELSGGTLSLRSMFSLDPLIRKKGYPLLLQTGETADGRTHLIDRQHPHDFFSELAASYSYPLSAERSVFLYVGYPGEPALGPTTFMHRFSGMENPEAPITHHWFDSTHITFGVITTGAIWQDWKLEASIFNGREPDEHRWNFDDLRLSSRSARLSWNPTDNWALQVSHGYLKSPESLEPGVDQRRTTASATYNIPFGTGNNLQTTLGWSMNDDDNASALHAFLFEAAAQFDHTHTVFARAEGVEKGELFAEGHPLEDSTFHVAKFTAGYVYDFKRMNTMTFGIGGLGSVYNIPDGLERYYGNNPASFMLFLRGKLD